MSATLPPEPPSRNLHAFLVGPLMLTFRLQPHLIYTRAEKSLAQPALELDHIFPFAGVFDPFESIQDQDLV